MKSHEFVTMIRINEAYGEPARDRNRGLFIIWFAWQAFCVYYWGIPSQMGSPYAVADFFPSVSSWFPRRKWRSLRSNNERNLEIVLVFYENLHIDSLVFRTSLIFLASTIFSRVMAFFLVKIAQKSIPGSQTYWKKPFVQEKACMWER